MKPARTRQTIRVSSNPRLSPVRTRTTRKSKSRRRPTPKKLPAKLAQIRERLELSH